jgi:DNA-binding NarL/FixJ family response regulator
MRVLLAIASNRTQDDMVQGLAAKGHQVVTTTARGEALLSAIERARPIHVALVSHAALGRQWIRLLRVLRRRLPGMRMVLVLRPGEEFTWRRAMMAGAYEALPASSDTDAVHRAVRRAMGLPPERLSDARTQRPAARPYGPAHP